MRILHNAIGFTFSNLQVQFQAGHGHKHPFLVIEQGEHKIHTKAEKLHGELATWEGEYTLQAETKPDHAAGTPFRITAHEHHHVAPDQLIAEGTFVVTANTFGPQQVNVVLTNKKGYQKGTAVFVLNIGGKSEVWSSPMASPKGGAAAGYASQGPLAVSASSVYGMGQPISMPMSMPMQQGYAQPQQGYQVYTEQADRGMSPVHSHSPQPSSPHSLLPQGRGSITYGPAGYSQADQTTYAAQGYSQGMQQVQRASSGSSMGSQGAPAGYPMQGPQQQVNASFSSSVNMAQPQSPPPAAHHGPAPSLGQQFFTHVEERPVTKEVVTYVQERRPIAKQYVVETRYTGEEHEIEGAAQQHIVGHHERIIAAPPPKPSWETHNCPQHIRTVRQQVTQQTNTALASNSMSYGRHAPQQFSRSFQPSPPKSAVNRSMASVLNMRASSSQQMAPQSVGQQYFTHVEERPVTKEVVTYVQERHPVAKQYVVEAHYTGEEHEVAGATQQHVVGHKERYISGLPVNYGNRDLYM